MCLCANLSKAQKINGSLLKVQGLLFQTKKFLTVHNNCGVLLKSIAEGVHDFTA